MHFDYKTNGVCTSGIHFDLDEEQRIRNVRFDGGCDGNLKAISKLVEGQTAADVAQLLEGNLCGFKQTSCADQLSRALKEALSKTAG